MINGNVLILLKYFAELCLTFNIQVNKYFTLDERQNRIEQNTKDEENDELPFEITNRMVEIYQQRCHRGLDLEVYLDKEKNITTNICLCPPSYYGDQCQYQNQRISLTLQFRVSSDSVQTPFIIIVSLIDHSYERILHSSEQLTYLSTEHCQKKFHLYLLYSTRPKDPTKEYFIHIDIYEKTTLNYRASFIKSIDFPFLPVHRLVYLLYIPPINDQKKDCLDKQCQNGKCIEYAHDPTNQTFCQCDQGWSGQYCTIPYQCQCSSSALCLGKLANNRSLCVCPTYKIGPRCLINNPVCQNITCSGNGQCIPLDDYGQSTKKFICICKKGFFGDRCETSLTKLMMLFDQTISLPSVIFIHFIEVKINAEPVRTTTFKSTLLRRNLLNCSLDTSISSCLC